MRFLEYRRIISDIRIQRYLKACDGNTKKAMTLYRLNLKLSQEFFTVVSCFEIALRNEIDRFYLSQLGNDWIRQSSIKGGIFDNQNCFITANIIKDAVQKLNKRYSHSKLVAELGFGFWRYLYAPHQYKMAGKTLLAILPLKPKSTAAIQYNSNYVFNQLATINNIRNRIAHHEPICFQLGQSKKDTAYVRQHYSLILQMFNWMNINEEALLYGLDHINIICQKIEKL